MYILRELCYVGQSFRKINRGQRYWKDILHVIDIAFAGGRWLRISGVLMLVRVITVAEAAGQGKQTSSPVSKIQSTAVPVRSLSPCKL